MRLFSLLLVSMAVAIPAAAQAAPSGRDLETRTRYEQVLARSPFQEQAFEQVYRSYAMHEGLDAWTRALEDAQAQAPVPSKVVRARIAARRMEHERAVSLLEAARAEGAEGAPFALLLGRLYHDTGRDDDAVALLEETLAARLTEDERGQVSRLLGNLLLRKGEREAAIAAWERIAEGAETDVFVLEELAMLYEAQRMFPEAIRAWERIVALAETDPYLRCRSLRAIGDLERTRGEYASAIDAYREALAWVAPGNWLFDAISQSLLETSAVHGDLDGLAAWIGEQLRTDPANADYRILLGDAHTRRQDWEAAEQAYREAIERAPGRRAGYAALIRLRETRGQPEGVVEAYREAVARFPDERDYHHRLGLALLRMGEREEAVAAWRAALGDQPQARDHATLAQWFESRGFREEALEAYEAAVALAHHRPWVMRLASLEYETGRRDDARARWLALADDDAGPDTLLDLAGALEGRGYREDAEKLLARALEKAPERLDIVLARADILLAMARFEDAEAAYEHLEEHATTDFYRARAERGLLDVIEAQGRMAAVRSEWEQQVREEPENLSLRLRLAQLCERMGDRGRALALYRESAALDPDNPALLQRLARAYESAGNPQEAIAAYRRLVEVDAARAGGYYRDLVPLLMQHGTEADAVQAAEQLVAGAPADPEARMLLARVYERFERGAQRLEAHREAVRLAPDEPTYHEALGRAMMDAGNFLEARDSFQAMLDAARDSSVRLRAVQQLASAHQRLNRFEDLVDELEARVQRAPRDLEGYELLAAAHRAAGTVFDSLTVLERAAAVADDRETALRRVLVEAHSAGQLDTVVRTYEELSRLAVTLDPREWEQLGRAYAQLGREVDAERAWDRMLTDHANDASVLRAYIRVMQEHGLQEQAFAATEQLLALQRHDYRTRLDYAQQLAAVGRVPAAMEQLRMLLQLGEGTRDTDDDEAEPGPRQRGSIPPFQIPPHLHQTAGQTSPSVDLLAALGVGVAPGGGAFNAVHRYSLHLLTQYAAREDQADELMAEYKARVADTPELIAAHHDLLLVLVTLNREEALLDHIDTMSDQFPDDPDVLRLAARMLEVHRRFDHAMAMYERLHEAENASDSMRMSTRIRLLTGAGRFDEARDQVEALRAAFPEHVGILRQAASQLAAMDDLEQAEKLFRAVGEIDSRHRQTSLQEIAHHYRNRGLAEDARRIYGELIFEPPPPGQAHHPPPPGTPPLYLPHARQPMSNSVDAVVRVLLPTFNWPRLEAFQHTVTFAPRDEQVDDLLERMAAFVVEPTPEDVGERKAAYEVGLLLAARAIEQGDVDGALRWVPELQRLGATEETIINIRLLAFEAAQDDTALRTAYDALVEAIPEEADRLRLAVARLAIVEENWDEAEAALSQVLLEPGRQREVVAMIRQLHDAGEHTRALGLLEVYLTDPNPLPDAYGLRIQILSAMGRHDEAVRYARESWEFGINQQLAIRGSRLGQIRSARDLQGSPMMSLLEATHKAADREAEMLAYLEEWAERYPATVAIELDLAHAYRNAGRGGDALDIYRGLVERRPSDRQLRLAYAQMLLAERRDTEAYAIFEEVLRADPSLYAENAWQVRQLYDRMGRSRELTELERRMAFSTTDQTALQQMAQGAANMGNAELAAVLYERLVRLAPGEDSFRLELAGAQRRTGDYDAALNTWRQYLTYLSSRPDRTPAELARAVDLFARMGVRHELETYARGRFAANPDDLLGVVLAAGIAYDDGDYEAAIVRFETLLDARPDDHAAFGMAVDLAQLAGDMDKAIQLINERSPGSVHDQWSNLAELYAAKGDSQRAYEYWVRDAGRMSGLHGVEQTMRRLVENGLYDKAIAYFDQHSAQLRGSGTMFLNSLQHALRAYILGGQADDEWLRATVAMIPEDPGWLTGYLTHRNFGLEARRMDVLRVALDDRPADPSVTRAVLLLRQQGRNDDTMRAMIERVLEADPDHWEAESGYANLLMQQGDEAGAVAFVEGVLQRGVTAARLDLAFRLFAHVEDYGAILALRDRHWDALEPADQRRLGIQWAQAIAIAGDPAFGLERLQTELEESGNQGVMDRYLDLRFRTHSGRDALAAFEKALAEGFFARDGHVPSPAFHIYADSRRLDDLFDLVWRHNRDGAQHLAMATTQRALSALRSAGAAPRFFEEWKQRMGEEGAVSAASSLSAVEALRRAGMLAWYETLLNDALAQHPHHWELVRRHAAELRAQGRLEEAAEVLTRAVPHTPLSRRDEMRGALLDVLVELGDEAAIDRLLTGALNMMALQPHEFGHNAALLSRAGRHEEAAAAWEQQARSAPNRSRALSEMALSFVRLGRPADALALYEADPDLQYPHTVVEELLSHDALDTALELAETAAELTANPHAVYPMLANAALASMELEELTATLASLHRGVSEHTEPRGHATSTVDAILRHRDEGEIVPILEALDDDGLWKEAARSLSLMAVERGPSPETSPWLDALGQRLASRSGAMLEALDAIYRYDAKEVASALLGHLDDAGGLPVRDALRLARFAMWCGAPIAPSLYATAFAAEPARLLDAPEGVTVLASNGWNPDWDAWLDAARDSAAFPAQWTLVEAALALGKGQTDEAATQFDAIEPLDAVRGTALEGLALWMALHGHEAELLPLALRAAQGGVQRDARIGVLSIAFRAAAGIGDIAAAARLLDAYAWMGMPPAWALVERGVADWPSDAREDAAAQLASMRGDLASGPAGPALAYLEYLLAGAGGSAAPWAEHWGLAPWQADMLALAVYSPRAWWVSPRHEADLIAMLTGSPGGTAHAALSNGTPLEDLEGWSRRARHVHDPAGLPGAFTPFLTAQIEQQGVYLATDVHSPDARAVILASSADDWHRVWINGTEVFTDGHGGPVVPGEDRYEATLEAGANRVVVWLGNADGTAALSFGIVENGEGLRFANDPEVDGLRAKR